MVISSEIIKTSCPLGLWSDDIFSLYQRPIVILFIPNQGLWVRTLVLIAPVPDHGFLLPFL